MKKEEALELLRKGQISAWNQYRKRHPNWIPDFHGEDLSGIDFVPSGQAVDLSRADLRGASLPKDDHLSYSRQTVNLEGAVIDRKTTVAESFDLVEHGAVFVSEVDAQSSLTSYPRVFISYAWVNEGVILAIDQWLRLKGFDTKLDKRDFFAGARIRDEIMRVMKDCESILIFYSQQSKDKPWPQFERELAADLEMEAKREGKQPPRIIYVDIDDTALPSVSEKNKIAIMAKGKRFELVCEEIYHAILQIPRSTQEIDLDRWSNYVF